MNNTTTKEKMGNIQRVQGIKWTEIVLCILAFVFARIGIQGQFYTLGIAYLGSICLSTQLSRWMSLFGVLGLVSLTSFSVEVIKYIFMMIFIQLIRTYGGRIMKTGNKNQQFIVVGVIVAVINTIAAIVQGMSWYNIGVGILEALVAMLLSYVLSYGVEVIRERRNTPLTSKESISMVLIFSCLLAGFVDFYIKAPVFKEIYFRDITTFVVIIGVLYLGGINVGTTMSVVTSGILVTIGYIAPHLVGVYGMMAVMGGVFLPLGRIGVIIGAGIGQIIGFIVFNKSVLDYSLIGAYLIAALVSLIIPKHYFRMSSWFVEKNQVESEQIHLSRIQHIITQRLNYTVSGFEKLGKSFHNKQAIKLDYTPRDIQILIEDTGEKICSECSMCQYCWKQDIENTYKYIYQMVEAVKKKGIITVGDLPDHFKSYCIHAESFAYFLSFKMDLIKQDMMWQNRFLENRALVAEELYAVANTLKGIIREVDQELYFNKEEEKSLREQLLVEGIRIKDVMIVENKGKTNHIDIYTKYCNKKAESIDVLQKVIKNALGYTVYLEKHLCDKEKGCHFKFIVRDMYRVTAGCAICAKEEVSGDVHSFMELSDNQYLLALADGMGSGLTAHEESATAIEMLEDFMGSGFKNDLAVKMINAALILKSTEEVFSTIDITLIDKRTGIAEFLKAGAATSFILRDGKVTTIKASSLPVGMIREVELEIKREQLKDNDVVIMVTDGMLQTEEDALGKEETFKHFIKEANTGDPQYIAEYLMQKSKGLLGVGERDDMTIIVAKIWKEL